MFFFFSHFGLVHNHYSVNLSFESPYRSTCNIPTSLSIRKYPIYGNTQSAPDSPRSTRSAPWSRSQQKGLFGVNSSPRSVRSASSRKNSSVPTHRVRSSSVDSHSSNDSKACKRFVLAFAIMRANRFINIVLIADAIEIVEHQIMKVNYRVALGDRIIHIENVVIVRDIDATNLAPKMREADAVFQDIENQPVQWNCWIRIINGVMAVNGDAMMALA